METKSWNLELFKKLFENDPNWTLTSYNATFGPVYSWSLLSWNANFGLDNFNVAIDFDPNHYPVAKMFIDFEDYHGEPGDASFEFKEYSSDFHDRINSLIAEYSSGNHS